MSVHEIVELYQQAIQGVQDAERKRAVIQLLPSLISDIRKLIAQVRESQYSYCVWTDVFRMPSIEAGAHARELTGELAKKLNREDQVLGGTQDDIQHLRIQLQEAVNAWVTTSSELRPRLSEFQRKWRHDISRLRAVAEIPDLLGDAEREVFNHMAKRLTQYIDSGSSPKTTESIAKRAADWQQLVGEFERVRQRLSFEAIADTYHLSAETVAVFEDLIEGVDVPLEQLSAQTLVELHRFKRFCQSVTLRFGAKS